MEHLNQTASIDPHEHVFVLQADLDVLCAGAGLGLDAFDGPRDDVAHRDNRKFHFDLAGLNATEVQQVVHQPGELSELPVNRIPTLHELRNEIRRGL